MGATPQRAMIAGFPQARTASEEDDVARGDCPPTVLGQRSAAERQAADRASAGVATSMADEHAAGPPRLRRTAPTRTGSNPVLSSDVHDRAGQRAGDAGDVLDLGDDQLAELVNGAGFDAGND